MSAARVISTGMTQEKISSNAHFFTENYEMLRWTTDTVSILLLQKLFVYIAILIAFWAALVSTDAKDS